VIIYRGKAIMTKGERIPDRLRGDIQGLRAVAVVAVIANHLVGWPTGGFVGVDVFFVVSGFLITRILLRAADAPGGISLRQFYARRIRRIVPTALLVLTATLIGSHFLFNGPRAAATAWDASNALLFTANWRFIAVGTDYFAADAAVSPLQQFWSLAVEEQFYLVWPSLLVVLFALPAVRRARVGAVVVVIAVVVATSFVFSLRQSTDAPTVAYFSTFTRAWELGAGALLAVASPRLSRMPAVLRFLLGWIGLAVIVGSALLIDGSMPFPGPWAAAPVAGALLVIAAGVGGAQHHLFPLVNPVSRFVGTISYSLYLWHLPVIVFSQQLPPQHPAVVAGLILVVSVFGYLLVEQPFHQSPWLTPRGTREARRDAWQAWRDRFGGQFILATAALVVVCTAVGVVAGSTIRDVAPPASAASDAVALPAAETDPETQLQADLASALQAGSWPKNLSPSLDSVLRTTSNDNPARECFDIGDSPDFDSCTWGDRDAPHHMYLVGDSTAMSYAPAFKAIAESSGGQWRITTVGLYGCRFTEVDVANDGAGVMSACPARKLDVAQHILADAPQLVVVSNAYALGRSTTGVSLSTTDLVASTLVETAGYAAAGRVAYLAPPPLGADLGRCFSPVSSPNQCAVGIDPAWDDFAAVTQATLGAGDHFVSSRAFSCYQGACPAFAGTIPT
jgi:peptidoglycan/LPS O-acetylase OafA/YrhL